MIKSTIQTQRSLDNSWTTDTRHGIPSGIIVDMQITAAEGLSTVTLNSLRGDGNGGLFVSLYANTGKVNERIAHIHTSTVGMPLRMESVDGVTAHILLGYIPTENKEFVTRPVAIHNSLVHFYRPTDIEVDLTSLEIIVDGSTVFTEVLERDITLRVAGLDLTSSVQGGAATISTTEQYSADVYRQDVDSNVSPVIKPVRSINHVYPNAEGRLRIRLSAEGLSVSGGTICATLKATDKLNAKLAPEDLLDKHLMPDKGREFSYYPLDDVYVSGNTLSTTRDTFGVLGGSYTFPCITGVTFSGGSMNATVEYRSLETKEPMYD